MTLKDEDNKPSSSSTTSPTQDDNTENDQSKSPQEETKNQKQVHIRTTSRNSKTLGKSSISDDPSTTNSESHLSDDEPEEDITNDTIISQDVYDFGKYGFDKYKINFISKMNEDEMIKNCGGVEYEFYGDPIKVEQLPNVNKPIIVDLKGNELKESYEDLILNVSNIEI